jgi:hypothetical protein
MSTICGGCDALGCLPYDAFDVDLGVRMSREKAGIDSDRNGCQRQQSSALHWPAQSNYRLNLEYVQNLDIQNP